MGMGEVPDGNLDTTTALIYDSVTAFAIALNKLDTVQQVICSFYDLDVCDLFERRKLLMNPLKLKCNLIVNVYDNRCVNNAWTVRASNLGRMGTLW